MAEAKLTQEQALAKLRVPFPPEQIGKLPKGGLFLDFVGHGFLTQRLLDADPLWNWEPFAKCEAGLPLLDENGGLWIRLTVCGVTRIGYGDAAGRKGPNAIKEAIGDALRNAGMRFGLALDLWCKGDPDAPAPAKPKSDADISRERLAAFVKKHKLNGKEIGQRFIDAYGAPIYEAEAVVIDSFADTIRAEVEGK
jgi:hypothetical protein